MTFPLEWPEVAVRLALTVVAGAVLGLDRTARDKSAGLRTTILVTLAASVSMIQTNLLLPTTGKDPSSFAVLDLMRLPLGILTGMGFIGAGAIVRKGQLVQGVTTAATLWLATVVGLCLGGGQIGLGLAALALGFAALTGLDWVERRLWREHRATLVVVSTAAGPTADEIRLGLTGDGYRVASWRTGLRVENGTRRQTVRCDLRWPGRASAVRAPGFIARLADRPGVVAVRWTG